MAILQGRFEAMGIGLLEYERNELRSIFRKYLDASKLEILIADLDLIRKTLPDKLEIYKKDMPDSIPLKKGDDSYKGLCKLQDDIGNLLATLDALPALAKNMANYSLDACGILMLPVYAGRYKIALQADFLDSEEEYPPTLGMDLDQYYSILKTLQSAALAAATNARLADKHLREAGTRECLMLQEVRFCLRDHLTNKEISYEGGSGTIFERVMSLMLGVGDSKDVIQNCDRSHKTKDRGKN